jgi:predicted adenylyl cyclase CyaB
MQELEVKILEVNREKVEQTLVNLGAQKIFDGDIRTLFFDFNDSRIRTAKDLLRLRIEEKDKIELTYKKVQKTKTVKQAEEYSVEVSSFESTKQILELIGLYATEDMLKHRISYKLGNVRFDIDLLLGDYKFIPEFLEIEAENKAAIYRYAELLGFKANDCLPWSTEELIRHYSKTANKTENIKG